MKKNAYKIIAACLTVLACAAAAASNLPRTAEAKYITKGDTAANIRIVQTRLKELGYYKIAVDGIWGAKTTAAVKSFQKDKKLTADGIVGAKTEAKLGVSLTSGGSAGTAGNDAYLLARCIYAEARGEPYTGMVAIGAVVLNRVKSGKFPNTVSGVIYQPWAFTAVNDGQINLSPNQNALNAARDALSGWDPTNGCLYYYNPATATSKWIWSLTVELKIGKHSFARA
ncbi:MAG: spore cortex-lytic enzyme [Clostridiales bacterium]|jgi:N-acetylmuramoyl-L-alanine amidase|nr:spore cortex-lytic enzyme [Clostridiales bacterium]